MFIKGSEMHRTQASTHVLHIHVHLSGVKLRYRFSTQRKITIYSFKVYI